MTEKPAAGISQDLVGLQLPRTGETGLMGGFLFELAVVEEHKGSPSAQINTLMQHFYFWPCLKVTQKSS